MKLDVINQKGESLNTIEVNDSVFGLTPKPNIIAQYVYTYLSNQRESNAHTKNRSEVSGGGKKPWKQKGTGRARFGSSRNPIWRKGGVAFGPRNTRNWKKKLTKKFKQVALKHALSSLLEAKNLKVINEINFDAKKPLTKQAIDMISAMQNVKKCAIVVSERNDHVLNAFSNIDNARVVSIDEVNVYDLVSNGTIIFDQVAIQKIQDRVTK